MSQETNLELEYILTPQTIREILNEFTLDIFDNRFYKNKDFLIASANYIPFESTWNLNPYQFCLDTYSVFEVYPVILLVNNLNSIFEFKLENIKDKIIAPSTQSMYTLLIS